MHRTMYHATDHATHECELLYVMDGPPYFPQKVLFLSMGGSSTQVVCVDAAGETHVASLRCGKSYFRRDAAERRACVEESKRLAAFVEARIYGGSERQ